MAGSSSRVQRLLSNKELIEKLASIEHDRWSHWQRYLHKQCEEDANGSLVMPAELVRRWSAQLSTPYELLSDQEKRSDQEEVMRYLPTIVDAIERELNAIDDT